MSVKMMHSGRKMLAQLILLVIPTAAFFALFASQVNTYFSILSDTWLSQSLFFAAGLAGAVIFYAFRFRFITTVLVLAIAYWFIYKSVSRIDLGEFDTFYFSIRFLLFSIITFIAWIVGFGLSRSRTVLFIWVAAILTGEILMISKSPEITAEALVRAFVPALAYAFYIIYTAELIRNMNEREDRFGVFLIKRLTGFAALVLLIFFLLFTYFGGAFSAVEKEWGGKEGGKKEGQDKKESMTEKDKDGGVTNKDQTRLTGSLDKDKQLVFVARLDNFFEDGRTPNPLYFTSTYYTKFDTATQTFEIDPEMPYNDLFEPDPSQIPLYFVKQDTGIIRKSLGRQNRSVVTAEVYKSALSSRSFLAPSNAFYCQPISIPREYRGQFKSAYRAKMWVSDLNSAYFIYNPADNYMLRGFQEQRFNMLRSIKKIEGPDKKFMDYYTYMPDNVEYEKITELAREITAGAERPIDKVILLRDYFLGKDEFGQPLFSYSDNPGVPGLPSANKLTYFLLENRKGYCAYYAGATLFMLRALGIPSRIVAGFLTMDRSNKNPGWYWFYQDQAHAWVQVYFQGYGWIDFDTTVPDRNTQQAEQPDGTPPPEMPQTYLVADGVITAVDTVRRTLQMKVEKMIFHDKDFDSPEPVDMNADVSIAVITTDTGQIALRHIKTGAHATAVSHAEALKSIKPESGDNVKSIIAKLPAPVPADEIKIIIEHKDKKKKDDKESRSRKTDWLLIARNIAIVLGALVLLLFLMPLLFWAYLDSKAKRGGPHAIGDRYRAALFYLNQLGFRTYGYSPSQLARQVDGSYGTSFESFAAVYQKDRYSKDPLSPAEREVAEGFYRPFISAVKRKNKPSRRILSFFNVFNMFYYFNSKKK